MASGLPNSILVTGLPRSCVNELVAARPDPAAGCWELGPVADPTARIPVVAIGEHAAEAIACAQQFRTEGSLISTLILGALVTPAVQSLEQGCAALDVAVAGNSLAPIRILSAFLPDLMQQKSGRVILVSFDPLSLKRPEDAALRGTAKGIATYLESLRPALALRGVIASTLFLRMTSAAAWNPEEFGPTIGREIAKLLTKPVRERTLRLP